MNPQLIVAGSNVNHIDLTSNQALEFFEKINLKILD